MIAQGAASVRGPGPAEREVSVELRVQPLLPRSRWLLSPSGGLWLLWVQDTGLLAGQRLVFVAVTILRRKRAGDYTEHTDVPLGVAPVVLTNSR